jgi:membrane protein implicated in regulation of membrane protease activity
MHTWTIVISLAAFWLGARIADNPLAGILVAAIVATFMVLGQRAMRRRRQANPPNRS